jgi:hypothetical protein
MIAVAILGLAPQVLGGITACEIDHYWTKVRDAPLAEAMSLELTTDRREYVVGEAVGFGVVLRNISSRRLEGNFGIIAPASPLVRIDYRRNGVMVDTIDRATIDPHGMVVCPDIWTPEEASRRRGSGRSMAGGTTCSSLSPEATPSAPRSASPVWTSIQSLCPTRSHWRCGRP